MISRDFPRHAVEDVLFESSSLRVRDLAHRAAIRDVLSRIQATGRVTQIQSPLDPRFANQISVSRHAALLPAFVTFPTLGRARRRGQGRRSLRPGPDARRHRLGAVLLGDPVLLRRRPRHGVGVLTVVVRHVSSFATAVARWVRVRGAPVCNPPRSPLFQPVSTGPALPDLPWHQRSRAEQPDRSSCLRVVSGRGSRGKQVEPQRF